MPGESWWAEEIPSPVEIAEAKVSLKRADKHVDYILTHCPPPEVYRRFATDSSQSPWNATPINAKEVCLLAGKVYCGECGSAMTGNRKHAGRNKTL